MLTDILKQALSPTNFKPTKAHCNSVYDHIITNTNPSQQKALSHIVGIKNRHPACYISQSAIATKQQKRARKTGNRWMKALEDLGLITKIVRPFKTCLYEPKPIFLDRHMRWLLDRVIKSFNFLNISMLLAMGMHNSPFVKNPYVYAHPQLQEENVPQRDNRILYIRYSNPSNRGTLDGPGTHSAESHRSGINLDRKSTDPRRGIPMEGRKRIKTLKLTRAGEIKLAAFPPAARSHADDLLRSNKKPVKDLFRFYWSLCKGYCEKNDIKPDWRLTFSLLSQEGIDNDAPGVNAKDPYEYEMVMPKHLDPTVSLGQTTAADNAPKHSIYATAQAPQKKEPELRSKLEANRAKLEALQSGDDAYLAFFASQMADMMKFVKTVD